jgi:hypothetical protein
VRGNLHQIGVYPLRRDVMCIEKRIDDLIEAGRQVLATDFDPVAFQHWRTRAVECLSALLGSDHPYTKYFIINLQEHKRNNLIVGGGILTAASYELTKKCREELPPSNPSRLECPSRVHPGAPKGRRRQNGTNCEPQLPYRPTSNGRSLRVRSKRRNTK